MTNKFFCLSLMFLSLNVFADKTELLVKTTILFEQVQREAHGIVSETNIEDFKNKIRALRDDPESAQDLLALYEPKSAERQTELTDEEILESLRKFLSDDMLERIPSKEALLGLLDGFKSEMVGFAGRLVDNCSEETATYIVGKWICMFEAGLLQKYADVDLDATLEVFNTCDLKRRTEKILKECPGIFGIRNQENTQKNADEL